MVFGGSSKRKSFYSNRLRKLSRNIKKNRYVAFDIETVGRKNKFYMGGIYWIDRGKERYEYFFKLESMIKFILSRKFRNCYIVATNLDFDFNALFYKSKQWNDFKLLMRSGKMVFVSYDLRNNHGKIKFMDTCNYVFWGVAKLGSILNSNKLSPPKFLGMRKPRNADERIELINYNRQDCKITHDFMNFIQDGFNRFGGNAKLTIGSTALNMWRMNYQPVDIIKEEFILNDTSVRDFIFRGYYGGRTEVFKRGTFKDLFYYDVNSLYPSVMRFKFPLPQSVKNVLYPSIENIYNYMGVSECNIITPEYLDKPLLPLKHKGKLIFPLGRFSGVWNHCELVKALELGYTIEPTRQIIYTETWYPFKEYVETLYAERLKLKEAGDPTELIVKLLLNSLYGKFATKKIEKLEIYELSKLDYNDLVRLFGKEEYNVNDDGMIIRTVEKEFNGIYSFPILSSYVTSYSRLLMYEYIDNENVIYTDTDSIVTNSKLYEDSKELGRLKLEMEIKSAIFIKPKFYMVDDHVRIKGVNKATKEDFMNFIVGNSVSKKKFSKLKESMRRNLTPNEIIYVTKTLDLKDDKRDWEHNNLNEVSNSKPVVVSLW